MINLKYFDTEQEWHAALTEFVNMERMRVKSTENRDLFLALTGGATPKSLYQYWAEKEDLAENISWWLGDERCVDKTNDARNEKMIFSTLGKAPWFSKNFHSWNDTSIPEKAASYYEGQIKEHMASSHGIFDIIILGLGPDGHIASLFPNSPELLNTENLCISTQNSHAGHRRVTLTYKAINEAKNILFIIKGQEKKTIVDQIMQRDHSIPAGLIKAPNQTLFWQKN